MLQTQSHLKLHKDLSTALEQVTEMMASKGVNIALSAFHTRWYPHTGRLFSCLTSEETEAQRGYCTAGPGFELCLLHAVATTGLQPVLL